MLTAAGSPLVAASSGAKDMHTFTIRALRGFFHKGEPVGPGSVLTVDAPVARQLIAMNKAELYDPPAPADATTTEPPPARRGRPPKAEE